MLKASHIIDEEFKYSSAFLKKVLEKNKQLNGTCLDIPCGTGRNIFLLAEHFENVTGVDIDPAYINSVKIASESYATKPPKLIEMDILQHTFSKVESFNLICNVHFYDFHLFSNLLFSMKSASFLLIETPACNGYNFRSLPTEAEIKQTVGLNELLRFEFNPCKKKQNIENRGSVKLLIKKTTND